MTAVIEVPKWLIVASVAFYLIETSWAASKLLEVLWTEISTRNAINERASARRDRRNERKATP